MPRGYVLQPTYRVRGGSPVVQLWGRLEDGPAFLVEDTRFRPYFFVPESAAGALDGLSGAETSPVELFDLTGEPVVRVEVPLPGDVPGLRERLAARGCPALEADIRFPYRFLIDRGIRATLSIDGPARMSPGGVQLFRDPELSPATFRPRLRWLSLDIETSADASQVYSAALVGEGYEEVLIATSGGVAREGVLRYPSESELLSGLAARIREFDPDVLLGWNVAEFDLRVLAERGRQLGVEVALGRGPGELRLLRDRGFTRQSRAEIPGRVVLDGIPLVRDALRLEDYRLETVARAVLGRGKRIDSDAPDAAAEITRLYREDVEALIAYNLEDARLVPEILQREGLLDLTLERSLLTGMPLDRVGASIASFDRLYLPALRARGVVAPSVDAERKGAAVRGGAVLESVPGLFRDVAVFDFKSLYPSLMRTFNLDPLAHARAERGDPCVSAPNGARFSTRQAILPELIAEFMQRREDARREGRRHADQAIKIMLNALFGVLGAAACRFFDADVANAITGFGQRILAWTREAFEDGGVRVIYGDTDSVFVQLAGGGPDPGAEAESLRERAAEAVAGRIRRDYGVEPLLTLELECIYAHFFMPRVRGRREGSKKRYAGLIDERLEIVGLESVRRDWPAVTRRLQEGLLRRLFGGGDVAGFAREPAARVESGELDAELVYAKRVRKGSLERYTATTPPHVQAARKIRGPVGPVVRYVVTRGGPEPVLPGRPLPENIDRAHYRERVLRPVADAILGELDSSFDEALGEPRQLSLL
ncbi:MAG: DNA polymerase II [Proteobacteria bacterium]|nr:DNA polymerase II [Pseudomonadota bacterium]